METDSVLLIDKPAGMTSFGVVARIRRVLSNRIGKKIKVGHCGTLDPFATGLMIIVTGKECRNAGHYTKLDKMYETTFILGKTSTTGDPEGELCDYGSGIVVPTISDINEVIQQFTGDISQRPPIFSAIKIAGQRAYKLAREGKEIEMPERVVTIHHIELLEYAYPMLKLRMHVSSGTYIRSLAVDIGESLGTGAYCSELRRTTIATWHVEQAKTLAEFGITD